MKTYSPAIFSFVATVWPEKPDQNKTHDHTGGSAQSLMLK
jgi:hypothetical protein